jgi:hypothetical protein
LRRSEAARYVVENYGIPCATKTLAKLACAVQARWTLSTLSQIGP